MKIHMDRKMFLCFVFGFFSVCIYCFIFWIENSFGTVTHEQLLWHVRNYESLAHMDRGWILNTKYLIYNIIMYTLFLAVFIVGCERLLSKYKSVLCIKKYLLVFFCFFFVASICVFCFKYVNVAVFIDDDSNFIDDNYYAPLPQDVQFDEKKNIIVVLGESLENYSYEEFANISYIKNLEQLLVNGKSIKNMQQIYGTGWTIGAITAWHFGLPLKTPSNIASHAYVSKSGFLPNAISIFDILRYHGYELSLVLGSDSRFSGKDILFSGHGNFNIFDKNYYIKQGFDLEKNLGLKEWGFKDSFTFERASEEFDRLKKTGRPFVLFVETVDTHFPKGFCPKESVKYHDIRDSIEYLDKNLSSFFYKMKEKMDVETDIFIILGDHYIMGRHAFIQKVKNRTLYNMIYGKLPDVPNSKKNSSISALDIAPTLLQCSGARWKNEQFGLGISIFSKERSLLDIYGNDRLNEYLSKTSNKYNSFY